MPATLRERLLKTPPSARSAVPAGTPSAPATPSADPFAGRPDAESTTHYTPVEQLKVDVHRRLIERLDLEALERIKDPAVMVEQIRAGVAEFLRSEPMPLSQGEREEIVEQIVYEITGLGPLEPFFRDRSISDILVNGPKEIYVEREGKLQRVSASFRNDAHLLAIIDRIVSRVGRRVDESSPMVDARLPDGSRVNAIIPPLALDGPVLSIRRFGAEMAIPHLVEKGELTQQIADVLGGCVRARMNILISGGTGSGKTTLLNALSAFIPPTERVITIEDAAELRLRQEHVVRLESRPPNAEGRGEVIPRDLVKNALRMRPDRIIIGEVRGAEALDMLQAMNTGHEGSLTTIHANSPRDALARLETMVQFAQTNLPTKAIREQMCSALNVILQLARLSDGTRRLMSVTEVTMMEGDVIAVQEIFRFRRRGIAKDGTVLGRLRVHWSPPALRRAVADLRRRAAQQYFRGKVSMEALALSLVFLAAVLLVIGGYSFANRERLAEAEQTRLRLRALRIGPTETVRIMRDDRRSTVPPLDAILRHQPLAARMERELVRSGLRWSVGELVLGSAVAGVLGMAVGQRWGVLFGALLFFIGLSLPFLYVERRRISRAAQIEAQLPEALDMIVNAMRAGFSLPAAMQFVGEELAAPLGTEFYRFSEEQRLGVDMREALTDLEERIGTLDAKLFATSLLVQRETGGALSEILTGLASVIRDRAALRDRVETLTAEPHASARVIGLLPLVTFGLLYLLDAAFMRPMLTTDEGKLLLGYGAVSAVVGYLVLSRMAKIDL